MIENRIDELFNSIENSHEYKSYINISDVLKKDTEIDTLIKDIKSLQKKSVRLEYNNDPKYKDIDKEIEEKVNILNNKPVYKEYLRRMNELNDILSSSSKTIENYINSKI